MDLAQPLVGVLPEVEGRVLQVLAGATRALSGREVHALVGSGSETAVRRVLTRLAQHGIVQDVDERPRTYVANREHLAWPVVETLLRLPILLVEALRQELADWAVPVGTAALVAGAVSGTGGLDSDIDVLLVRSAQPLGHEEHGTWCSQLDRLRERVTTLTGNACRIRELDDAQLDAMVRNDDPLVGQLRRDALVIQGDALSRLHFQVADWFG